MQNEMQTSQYLDDEIDLLELWNSLWAQKWLITLVTAVVTSLGISYALVTTPIYKATSYFLPPLQQDVQSLSLQNMQNMQNMSPDFVYQRFCKTFSHAHCKSNFMMRII